MKPEPKTAPLACLNTAPPHRSDSSLQAACEVLLSRNVDTLIEQAFIAPKHQPNRQEPSLFGFIGKTQNHA